MFYMFISKGKRKFPFTLTLSLKKLDFSQVMTALHLWIQSVNAMELSTKFPNIDSQ